MSWMMVELPLALVVLVLASPEPPEPPEVPFNEDTNKSKRRKVSEVKVVTERIFTCVWVENKNDDKCNVRLLLIATSESFVTSHK